MQQNSQIYFMPQHISYLWNCYAFGKRGKMKDLNETVMKFISFNMFLMNTGNCNKAH